MEVLNTLYAAPHGKAERFIQTALREWAYAYRYPSLAHRADELAPCDAS